jgi:ankyrin repeat protein
MHLAIRRGTPALVDALMDAGASPNDRDEAGRTPLHRLVLGNNIDAQKISLAVALIAKGAACELGLCAHHEALYFAAAAAMGDDAIAHTINALRTRDGRGRWTHRGAIAPIAIAVTHDNHAVVRDLIARGAHVDAGTDGETALKIAAERLDTEMVRTLADAGAHPNRARAVLVGTLDQRHLERSPRDAHASHDTATRKKMEAIAAMLIAAGADVNAARPSRWGHNTTALHIAATNGLDTIVKMLLEAGADPQRTCRQGGGSKSARSEWHATHRGPRSPSSAPSSNTAQRQPHRARSAHPTTPP